MHRNVEIKAVLRNLVQVVNRVKELSKSGGEIIKQHDVFYNVSHGRLKTRTFLDGTSELIYYSRPETEGPKLSEHLKYVMDDSPSSDVLKDLLKRCLGARGVVCKSRHLFLVGQTRIHIDSVEGLGDFLELEVVLRPEQTVEDGQLVAVNLMEELGVETDDLLVGAYIDLLQKKSKETNK